MILILREYTSTTSPYTPLAGPYTTLAGPYTLPAGSNTLPAGSCPAFSLLCICPSDAILAAKSGIGWSNARQ